MTYMMCNTSCAETVYFSGMRPVLKTVVGNTLFFFCVRRWWTGWLTSTALTRALMTGNVVLLVHTVLRLHCLHYLEPAHPISAWSFWRTDSFPNANIQAWPDLRYLLRPRGGVSRVLTALGRSPDVIHHTVRRWQTLCWCRDIFSP
jgi:hypothetical protein